MPNIQSVPSLYIKVYKRPAFLVHSDSQLLPVWEMQPRWGEGVVSISSRLHENPCDRISKVELQRKLSEKDKMDWKADKTNSWCWVDRVQHAQSLKELSSPPFTRAQNAKSYSCAPPWGAWSRVGAPRGWISIYDKDSHILSN